MITDLNLTGTEPTEREAEHCLCLLLQQVLEKQGHLIVMSVAEKAVGDVIPGLKKTLSYPGFSFALAITGFATAEEFERQRAEFFPNAPPVDAWNVWDGVTFYRTVAE